MTNENIKENARFMRRDERILVLCVSAKPISPTVGAPP